LRRWWFVRDVPLSIFGRGGDEHVDLFLRGHCFLIRSSA
jgi:hypothetical protein